MKFQITAWDSYNWHNLLEQHHRLRPGDILCIGPSESGKTTILDAIQQVITGDTDLQMNSAADPVRAKTELKEKGRSLLKIVLRIEEDESFLGLPGVNIAYFVLELTDIETKEVTVLALGAKAHSEGRTVDKWWLLGKDVRIDDVRFHRELDGKKYALDKEDLRERNPKCSVFDTARFRLELVDLLFPMLRDQPDADKRAHLQKWATYLNIAKSYGRMHSVDVNRLIRDALPEPRIEAFEIAKRAINEINEIRTRVNEADQRLEWMTQADGNLRHARERQARLSANEYRRLKIVHERLRDEIARLEEQRGTQQGIAERKRAEEAELKEELNLAQARVRALDNPEARALMDEIRRRTDEIEKIDGELGPLTAKLSELREAARLLQQKITAYELQFSEARNTAYGAIAAQAKILKNPLRDTIHGLAEAVKEGGAEDIRSAAGKADAEKTRSIKTLVELEQAQRALAATETAKIADLFAREKRLTEMQDLAPIAQAAERAGELGNRARLLYQGIEILPGRESDAILLQEFLGTQILSAILPATPDLFDIVKRHVHATDPELLVVEPAQLADYSLLTGLLQCIDIQHSDPMAIRYLAAIAGDVAIRDRGANREGAERIVWRDGSVYDGKAWRIEIGAELRYLGRKARQDARQKELDTLRQQMDAARVAADRYSAKAIAHDRERIALEHAMREITEIIARVNFEKYRSDIRLWNHELAGQASLITGSVAKLNELKARRKAETEAHARLVKDAESSGAKKRVEQQAEAEKAVKDTAKKIEDVQKAAAQAEGQANLLSGMVTDKGGKLETAAAELSTGRETLTAFSGLTTREAEDLLEREGINKLDEQGIRASNSVHQGWLEKHKVEVRRFRDELVRHNEDVEFLEDLFLIRETRSGRLLQDRIKELQQETQADRKLQIERVKNIQHQQVIEPIGEMLKDDLINLDKTTRNINDHLKKTPFNGRRYVLTKELRPEAPKLLVKLISDYDRANTEPFRDELLRLFSEEERTAAQLQEYFDYRTWFAFELQRSKPIKGEEFATAAGASGSGGAQAAPHYILSYAMLTMFYRTSDARTWLILLDEAFTRVDIANRFILYEMAKDLGFTVVAANTEFDGHTSLRKTANILFVKKDPKTFETHVKPWAQDFHEGGQTRLETVVD